jgi:hypothetical protein
LLKESECHRAKSLETNFEFGLREKFRKASAQRFLQSELLIFAIYPRFPQVHDSMAAEFDRLPLWFQRNPLFGIPDF